MATEQPETYDQIIARQKKWWTVSRMRRARRQRKAAEQESQRNSLSLSPPPGPLQNTSAGASRPSIKPSPDFQRHKP